MARYAVISKGLLVSDIERIVKQHGGKDIRYAPILGQVFCTLEDEAARRLDEVPGITVKPVKSVSTEYVEAEQVSAPVLPKGVETMIEPCYSALQGSLFGYWYQLREMSDPPITGLGGNCALLDSGVRKSHRGLRGKVVYEANLSNSPTYEDVFNHGTGCAYILCGGMHALGQDSGLAPGAYISNIKVLDDNGVGSEENVVLGLEEVYRLIQEAFEKGYTYPDEEIITAVNLSFGAPDDGDPDNPIRVACRKVVTAHEKYMGYRMMVIAAAGNQGPAPGSICSPACDPEVFAVGSCSFVPFEIMPTSSRGPTKEGYTKPDVVFFGSNIAVASATGDDDYTIKSGTSFAAPYIVGGGFNGWEVARRFISPDITIDRQGYTEFVQTCSVKPEGAPVPAGQKDNTYGWGLPLGSEVVRRMTGMAAPAMALTGMTDLIAPVIGLGMVGMMMSNMMKGMKV